MKQGIMFCSAILGIVGMCAAAQASNSPNTVPTLNLPDPDIVTAFQKAATQNVLPAVNSNVFPGYWCVCADGQGYGYGNTYLAGEKYCNPDTYTAGTSPADDNGWDQGPDWDSIRWCNNDPNYLPMQDQPGTQGDCAKLGSSV